MHRFPKEFEKCFISKKKKKRHGETKLRLFWICVLGLPPLSISVGIRRIPKPCGVGLGQHKKNNLPSIPHITKTHKNNTMVKYLSNGV